MIDFQILLLLSYQITTATKTQEKEHSPQFYYDYIIRIILHQSRVYLQLIVDIYVNYLKNIEINNRNCQWRINKNYRGNDGG